MSLFNLTASLSGITAASTRLNVSADNVARRDVPLAEKNRVVAESNANGGVATTVQAVPMSAEERADVDAFDPSNIDYAEEFVGQIVATAAFEVNVKAVNTQLTMLGTLLDMKV